MILTLLRHGETSWNKEGKIQGQVDNPLNETGIMQAHEAAKKLANYKHFDYYVSSGLIRAIKTLDIVKEDLNINKENIIFKDLQERDFGESEGKTINKENLNFVYSENVKGIETFEMLSTRVKKVIREIYDKYPNSTVLGCSHSHFIKCLIKLADDSFDFRYKLSNLSINTFEVSITNDDLIIKLIEFDK